VEDLAAANGYSYIFSGSEFFTAFNNTPDLNNLKNDYSVWGVRKSISGSELPVHMRYAIDKKPWKYTSIEVDAFWKTNEAGEKIQLEGKDAEEITAYNTKYGFNLEG